jgi:ribosomal protein S18 acetylase RimI-like enzyme
MVAAMAALPEAPDTHVVDLRKVFAADLAPVLEEEARNWRNTLNWDLAPATELVRRFVSMQALNGFALMYGAAVIGYAYYVREEHKGLIGGLYVLEGERTPERVHLLVNAVIEGIWRLPGIRRVESQLLMLGLPLDRRMPFAHCCHTYPRWFMEAPAAPAEIPLRDAAAPGAVSFVPLQFVNWTEAHFDSSAQLVAAAYRGHVDSEINDQYRSPSGARRFLTNIIQYPGCGTFYAAASFAAIDPATGALAGISLASLVAPDSGHITQLCVAPQYRRHGVGREILRRSRVALAANGCKTVSLTVTEVNRSAIALYEEVGFTMLKRFAAHVWDLR